MQDIKKSVGMIKDNPPNPVIKCVPNLSNARDVTREEITNTGMAHIKNLWSVLIKGKVRKKRPKGIMKK